MKRKYKALFSPLDIGGVTLKNRIIAAPMTYPILTADGCLTPEAIAFYELRAKGGAAAVMVSEVIVHSETGKYYPVQVLLDAPNAKDSLATAARAIKRHGAIAGIELSHGGKYAIVNGQNGRKAPPFGPSMETTGDGKVTACEMSKELIAKIIESYGRAASFVKQAGFEMILIHAGHGWLLQQFLSPISNKRTDEYGGSLENRARLTLDVLDRVREEVGREFPIELRISAEEYMPGGYSFEDVIGFAKLVEQKIDLLQVSTGSHEGSFDRTHPSMFMARGANVHYAQEIKKHVSVPVATIGALNEPEMLEDIVVSGKADVVEMARALLADPYLPKKAFAGRDDEIVRCCRCFVCMAERMTTGLRICALNPVIGSEYELSFSQSPSEPKRVLVVGGGPGGMEAALQANKRGHSVILCEKTSGLGGALNTQRGISFKEDLYAFIKTKERMLKKAGVEIRLNTEVTPEYASSIDAEVLIIAVGAEPVLPDIPGITGENVLEASALTANLDRIGKNVVVLGGGQVGCESALYLAQTGREVTVVEQADDICRDANGRHRPLLLSGLTGLVRVMTGTKGLEVSEKGLICENAEKKKFLLEADTVIVAAGRRPLRKIAEALYDCAPEIAEVGDCVKPGQITQALFRGYFAAMDI
ncbi:MAG: FAD-dependent oxidoreductase [Clostridiales bacterium]|nr:FAD-dependent oxidoreductase [Clostridiales bacterium]